MGGEDSPVVGTRLRVGVHQLAGGGPLVASLLYFCAVAGRAFSMGGHRSWVAALVPGMILARETALGGAPSGRWGFTVRENL
jgi:hypothetical protein